MLVKPSKTTKVEIAATSSRQANVPVAVLAKTYSEQSRAKADFVKAHQPKTAATLMRGSVKRPDISPMRQVKANGLSEGAAVINVSHRPLAQRLEARQFRAQAVSKSDQVQHFSKHTSDKLPVGNWQPPTVPEPPRPKDSLPSATTQPTLTSEDKLAAMFERAIEQSTAHEQPAFKLPTLRQRLFRGRRSKVLDPM